MPDARRRWCKVCRRHESEVGAISWRGMCGECGIERMHANNDSIHEGHGEGFERRRYGYARTIFGPRVALALKQAGVFDTATLDDPSQPA